MLYCIRVCFYAVNMSIVNYILFAMNIFRRVDEFSEYGDLDMMMQYVKDVQTVQRKLADCTDSITFINEVMNVDD